MKEIEDFDNLLKKIGKNIAYCRNKTLIKITKINKVGRFGEEKEDEDYVRCTQKMLADKLGVSERTIIRIEKGEIKNLTLETLLNISKILNKNICEFLDGTSYFPYNISSKNEDMLQSLKDSDLKNLIEKIIYNVYQDNRIKNEYFKKSIQIEKLNDEEILLLIKTISKFL